MSREVLEPVDARDATGVSTLHATLDELLGRPTHRLAAYGTLRPGESNHAQVSALRGRWQLGAMMGDLRLLASEPERESMVLGLFMLLAAASAAASLRLRLSRPLARAGDLAGAGRRPRVRRPSECVAQARPVRGD